jgi:hypothetical protein
MDYPKHENATNAAADENSTHSHVFGAIRGDGLISIDTVGAERDGVLAILSTAYRIARHEHRRIQADLDLLVGIARAVEAGIYEPAFALERAVEHGLVAWPDVEVAP